MSLRWKSRTSQVFELTKSKFSRRNLGQLQMLNARSDRRKMFGNGERRDEFNGSLNDEQYNHKD